MGEKGKTIENVSNWYFKDDNGNEYQIDPNEVKTIEFSLMFHVKHFLSKMLSKLFHMKQDKIWYKWYNDNINYFPRKFHKITSTISCLKSETGFFLRTRIFFKMFSVKHLVHEVSRSTRKKYMKIKINMKKCWQRFVIMIIYIHKVDGRKILKILGGKNYEKINN